MNSNIPTIAFKDFYKVHHPFMYLPNMNFLYTSLIARKSRLEGVDHVVAGGFQKVIKQYLIDHFNKTFFFTELRSIINDSSLNEAFRDYTQKILEAKKNEMLTTYTRVCNVDTKHIEEIWELGYLPLKIKVLPEGTVVPIGVPLMTIQSTYPKKHPFVGWLVNTLESLLSAEIWPVINAATLAHEYKKIFMHFAKMTDRHNLDFTNWQGHDFSFRGHHGIQAAILSGIGHLFSFYGTDTIPAIYELEDSYNATGLIGGSVPVTEHSIESMNAMGTMEGEYEHTLRLLSIYSTGIVSKVSDTTDLWSYITEVLPKCKEQIMARDGKLVIRPDSGNPIDILCGLREGVDYLYVNNKYYRAKDLEYDSDLNDPTGEGVWSIINDKPLNNSEIKGVIELLWDIFGGTINDQGYKVLDPHIGAIYGDSITLLRAREICTRLEAKGFATTNWVAGIGSMTYVGGEATPGHQHWVSRDLFGLAFKASYGELLHEYGIEAREIFKDPITDNGTKKSKKGLLQVTFDEKIQDFVCKDQCTKEEEDSGLLEVIFEDGKLIKDENLETIRKRLSQYV